MPRTNFYPYWLLIARYPMMYSFSGDPGSAGEGILTVLDRYHPGQNYRIAKETLHNRDRAWMNEYILKQKNGGR